MANKQTTRERVAALLAEPAKASHDDIVTLQAALQDDIAGWYGRLQAINKGTNGPMGPERRKLLESGSVEDVLKLDIEGEQLQMWMQGAQAQHAALRTLDTQVFARESLKGLPAQYAAATAKLERIGKLNADLLEGWRELEGVFGDTEQMRNAVKRSGEAVPIPGPELAEALEVAYNGVCPAPAPSVFESRANVGDMLGLDARVVDTGGMRRVQVRVAA